jgi:glucokinase
MILAGDIGGTKTDLALFDDDLTLVVRQQYPSREHGSLAEVVRVFLGAYPAGVDAACFGVSGPVRSGVAATTNLPWTVRATLLADATGLGSVGLINDLEATAFGVTALSPNDVAVLQTGVPDAIGHQAVIAAGTGLGEAGLFWDGRRHRPYGSEGGHASFAPRNDLEMALLTYLTEEFGHVSYERVLSGPGLFNIYRFLRETGRGEEPAWLTDELRRGDPPAVIGRAALAATSALARTALRIFVSIYGAEAGNLALKTYATGGVFVAGGIAPKLLGAVRDGTFVTAFADKGRMRGLLNAIPVRVVTSNIVNLLGAAHCARLVHPSPA